MYGEGKSVNSLALLCSGEIKNLLGSMHLTRSVKNFRFFSFFKELKIILCAYLE